MMTPKITAEHLQREAVVYVRQSSPGQVLEHTESQRLQYALAETARAAGFAVVTVIDDDLGRSGSGLVERPGFQRLVAAVCGARVGAIFCIEASRLARNGRDWHHLLDLCALVGTLLIDPEGAYDPRQSNDRLLLGLKGTMSEYELTLLRQRGLAARDAKAKRGELRFRLSAGYCWDELGRIELDPDARVAGVIELVFRKFRELGSIRQVLLWFRNEKLQLPVVRSELRGTSIQWQDPAYHNVLGVLRSPLYAGAYAFGRSGSRTHLVEGRPTKTNGHRKPRGEWSVLLRDHHRGYITWEEFEKNQGMIEENAHMKKRAARKAGRGGRALLTGLARCGRCGRMLHVFYAAHPAHAHRYQCRGDQIRGEGVRCVGIGGLRVDRAIVAQLLEVVSPHAVDAALAAAERVAQAGHEVRQALVRELEEANYAASLAARRYEAVDPTKRLVARELEARWEEALKQVARLEARLAEHDSSQTKRPGLNREVLLRLAQDLPSVWNKPTTEMRTKQRILHLLVQEVIVDLDAVADEVVLVIHWAGGRHTEVRLPRVRTGRYPKDRSPNAVDVLRKLGGAFTDRDLAVTMNRMRCKGAEGATWTEMRTRELRERLGIAAYDPSQNKEEMLSADRAAQRLGICVGSVHRLIKAGLLPATQLMPSAPWQIPASALDTEAVQIGVRGVVARRPRNVAVLQDTQTLRLPET